MNVLPGIDGQKGEPGGKGPQGPEGDRGPKEDKGLHIMWNKGKRQLRSRTCLNKN